MCILVAKAFAGTISFCREASKYFASRLRRLVGALDPREMKQKALYQIRTSVLEISKEIEVTMLEKIMHMEVLLKRVDETTLRLEMGAAEFRAEQQEKAQREDLAHLTAFRRKLGLPGDGYSRNCDVEGYCSELGSHLGEKNWKRRVWPPTWALYEGSEVFQSWTSQGTSQVLLLGGSNYPKDSQDRFNWLSYASVLLTKQILDAQSNESKLPSAVHAEVVLRFFCQMSHNMTLRQQFGIKDVVKHLIYQLAEQHPDVLKGQTARLYDFLESDDWRSPDYDTALDAASKVLVDPCSSFERETKITIVIDRLDQCKWGDDWLRHKVNGLEAVVWMLLDVVQALEGHCVRALLVMDDGPAIGVVNRLANARKARRFAYRVGWDQQRNAE